MIFCSECGQELPDNLKFCPSCGTPVITTKKSKKESIPVKSEPTNSGGTVLNVKQTYGIIDLEKLPKGHEIDNRYTVEEKLGQGSFGAVYKVYDRELEIEKALKIIPEAISNDKEAMISLRKEASIMAKLNHTNIVHIYDFHYSGEIKYIDMEYVEGESLADIKTEKPNKKFTEEEVKQYAIQILEGLNYAHKQNVIHKDIKPQNIMLDKSGKIRIMDFGIAESVQGSMSRLENTGSSGTLVYMSPEQIRGKDVGKEADIYSLGATLYELLNGNPPFYKGDITYQIINKQPENIKGITEQMNEIIQKCLKKDMKERYSNCEEFGKALLNKGIAKDEVIVKENSKTKPKTIINEYAGEMIFVKGGTFSMGSNDGEANEKPIHEVYVDDFYIGKYVVTQKHWKEIMGNNPSRFKGDNLPVEYISWNDLQQFIKKINQKTVKHYRLPTEAEWEYAARGGKETIHESFQTKYAGSNNIDNVAWYGYEKSGKKTQPVGTKQPNELGIYDMSGNVWEWCSDWYDKYYYSNSRQNNPQGHNSGKYRILRGGSWSYNPYYCRVAKRGGNYPVAANNGAGFRLVQ